jgi:hypothetical protein
MKKIGVTVIAVLIVCAGFGQTSNNHQSTLDSVSAPLQVLSPSTN